MSQGLPVVHEYRVPKQLSLGGMMLLMIVFTTLFGVMYRIGQPAAVFLYFGSLAMLICVAQMWYPRRVRLISITVGASLLPMFVYSLARFDSPQFSMGFLGEHVEKGYWLPWLVGFGGLMGYCVGAIAAGIFLVIDKLRRSSSGSWQ